MRKTIPGVILVITLLAPAITLADPLPCQDQGLGAHCEQNYASEVFICEALPGASSQDIEGCTNEARVKRDDCRANANTCNP